MASKKATMEMLSGVPLFGDLSQKDLKNLVESGKEVHHEAGKEVMTEGNGGIGFHLILDGSAKVTRSGRTVAKLGSGEFFGEMAVIDDGPRSASVVAETAMTTFFLSRWDFRPIIKNSPEMAWKLVQHLVGRLREEQTGRSAVTS